MSEKEKVTVDDIIGIVHTDEPTDSVDEVRKLRGRTNERFIVDDAGTLIDMVTRNTYDYVSEVCPLLNRMAKENEQLKSFKQKVFKLIDDNIQIYEDTTTNDDFLQIQLDTKLQTLYNLRKELQE